ncbi:hypothetical protein NDU88_009853 [Pleurodeles waltl]|uniref:Uncharacterized protein n=1 Tax=Pleurodeles waltl TaxID=8319 RepID=A0AAV7S1K3_PLEWA|nr:hypothetical protein NDU88_009853 [Pleurodeles waltl]
MYPSRYPESACIFGHQIGKNSCREAGKKFAFAGTNKVAIYPLTNQQSHASRNLKAVPGRHARNQKRQRAPKLRKRSHAVKPQKPPSGILRRRRRDERKSQVPEIASNRVSGRKLQRVAARSRAPPRNPKAERARLAHNLQR